MRVVSVKGMKDGLVQVIQALILENFDVSIDPFVVHKSHLKAVEFHGHYPFILEFDPKLYGPVAMAHNTNMIREQSRVGYQQSPTVYPSQSFSLNASLNIALRGDMLNSKGWLKRPS
jgi:hypothetical protein